MYLNKTKQKYLIYIFLTSAFLVAIAVVLRKPEFPHTMVINLDKRPDRMEEIRHEFRHWPKKPERISAVSHSPGWKGCSASHLKCVMTAKERGYPWVLIVEDDCILTSTALTQFQSLLPYLWKNKDRWDIFYGGTTYLKHKARVTKSPPIYEVSGYTTHFCLIHKSTYDKILELHPKNISEFKDPIDVFYAENFRIWTTTPFFAKQRPGPSDINLSSEDYNIDFDKAEKILMSLRSS